MLISAALFAMMMSAVPDGGEGIPGVPPPELAVPAVDVAMPKGISPPPSSPVVRDPSASLSVQDATSARAEAKDAAELLATIPGVLVQDSGGAGQRKTLSLRGAAPNAVLVLLDGVPLTGPGMAMDLSRLPIAALDRIEVLRGGGSARYGPGAMGGVVNLVTRAPDGARRFFADAALGSFLTTQLSLGGTSPLWGGDGLLLLHGLRSEGTFDFRYDEQPSLPGNTLTSLKRVNNGALQGGALIRFRKSAGETELDFLGEGSLESRGLAGPVQNPSPSASQSTARGMLSGRAHTRFKEGGTLGTLGWFRLDGTALQKSPLFGPGEYRQVETSAGAEAVYSQLVAGRHGLTALVLVGGDWLSAPGEVNPSWGRLGAMLADELLFLDGDLAVSGSARIDVAGPFAVFSPKLGLVAELPGGFSVRANAGQASRPPAFIELYVAQGALLPNSTLRPERALTGDLGVGWKSPWGKWGVTGFVSLYEDLISYEYYPPNLSRPYNFQAARVSGLELEAAVSPWPFLEATASYTFLDTQNQKDDPRYYLKALPFRPAHRLQARIAGGLDWLQAHAEVLFQSTQYINRTQTLALPERALVNMGLIVRPGKDPAVALAAELKNVADVQAQDFDGYPLSPRAFFVTLSFAWKAQPASDVKADTELTSLK